MSTKLHPLVVPAIGVLGVVIGTLVTYSLSLPAERYKLLQENRANAYLEWLNVRELYHHDDTAKAESFEFKAQVALNQIVVYGHGDVVDAIYQFAVAEVDHPPNKKACKKNWKRDVAIYKAMRHSLDEDQPVGEDAIALLMLRCNTTLRPYRID